MRRGLRLATLLLTLCATGCAVNPTRDIDGFSAASGNNSFEVLDRSFDSERPLVLPVVHDQQTRGPSCGAHVLASVVNYWRGPDTLNGDALFLAHPPESPSGYSMAELVALARAQGLLASAVRLPQQGVIAELENGRPVLLPVRLPSIYVQQRIMPGGNTPVVGLLRNAMIYRAGRVSEFTGLAMVDHYVLAVGHDEDSFAVIEPVMGYRTIGYGRLARYRGAFADAAIVFSGARNSDAAMQNDGAPAAP